ncbi:MAG: protein kinase [Acidobacteriota bacterium]
MPLAAGDTLGHYEILGLLGAGGMGEVYRARDPKLKRDVAVKVLSAAFAHDSSRVGRFQREAEVLAAINHPNIATIYAVETSALVMELVEGESLRAVLNRGPLALKTALHYAVQIADALAAAHDKGVVHRDLKPANIMVRPDGVVKVLDFGLARILTEQIDEAASTETLTMATEPGVVMGTVGYMSPEQVSGSRVDHRTDVFAFGVVLYEMVTGVRPFAGSSAMAICNAILHAPPRDFGDSPAPGTLKAIIRKLLEKDPANRYGSAAEVRQELKALETSMAPVGPLKLSKNMWITVGVAAFIVVVLAGWLWRASVRERWVRETASPEILRLVEAAEYVKAVALVQEARAILPKDPALEDLWIRATAEVSITSEPAEADVSIRPYRGDPNEWQSVGHTPLVKVRVPKNEYVWRVSKPGFAPSFLVLDPPFVDDGHTVGLTYRTTLFSLIKNVKLLPEQTVPPGMVAIKGSQTSLSWPYGRTAQFRPDDFLIDQHEVTNEEYKRFVEAGGYQKEEFWTEPFVQDGRTVPRQEAIARLVDTTGRPGPATWEVGSFPKGLEKHPVAGVTWYEAAAYARFAGKSLPTAYHWMSAAQTSLASLIVADSNFSGKGTVPVGGAGALSGFGTTDMAGNVKEWALNETVAGKRFILGGGFGEPSYMFNMTDARSPWERGTNYGFRCAKLTSPLPPAASAKLELSDRDVWQDQIVSDEFFKAFRGLYAYDHADVHARVEATQSTGTWTHETIILDAAYGTNEHVVAHLFLPKGGTPPFQTVVYFPGANALLLDKFNPTPWVDGDRDYYLKSGRAVLVPIYKGTFERRDDVKPGGPAGNAPAVWRDHVIMWSKDLSRSLDYLEGRSEIDKSKIAFSGYSLGGGIAPILLAMEGRFKAAVLSSGGFWFERALFPEADGTNFVTRVKLPVLMLNARYDILFPVETAQLPIFRRLGTPDKDKKHITYEAGHGALPYREEVRETLDWLDQYLGPVRR